ncbi:MAG: transporter substrate-binding domain-containing protein [Candidatus Omnitrophota bacterium]
MTNRITHFSLMTALYAFCFGDLSIGVEIPSASPSPRLQVQGDFNFPPYEFLDDKGEPTGFNIDLIREVAEVMNLDVEIHLGSWNSVREALEKGEIDILAGMFYSPQRDKTVDFSIPHTIVTHAIFIRKDSPPIRTEQELNGKEIVVQRGDIMHDYALEMGFADRLTALESPGDALKQLASGKYDCALVAKFQGLHLAKQYRIKNIVTVGPPLCSREYCFAVKEGDTALLEKLNEGLNILKSTGVYKTIYSKWFSILEPAGISLWKAVEYAAMALIPLLLLLIFVFLWSWSLKIQVRQRTKELELELKERKRTEEALFDEKERLAVTLRSIGDGVIAVDTIKRIVLLNKMAEQFTGWREEEAKGKDIDVVFRIIHEKTRRRGVNPIDSVLDKGSNAGLENHTILIAKDGTERVIADSGSPIKNMAGETIGVVLVFRDVTEERKMEAELFKARKLESIGLLAGGIAHDFNNLLTAILGNLSIAKLDIDSSDRIYKPLSDAEKACLRSQNLTRQLLTFAKGGAPIRKTSSIKELVEDSATFVLSGSNSRCEFSVADDLWTVEVDEGQISQVIQNIVINADQAMPNGGAIRIRLENYSFHSQGKSLSSLMQEGDYVRISVKDNGIGIPQEYLFKIFDPYFTTKQKGSGLGLATAYSIIRKHDGAITVDSKPGDGTEVVVYLPASPQAIIAKETVEGSLYRGEGKILVMDDDASIQDVVRQMLEHLGFETDAADDGKEAVERYKKAYDSGRPFGAVILDLTIPGGMGGKETIEKLREIDPGVRAVVSSGYSNDSIMAEYDRFGFSGVVSKPYKLEELSEVMRRLFQLKNAI